MADSIPNCALRGGLLSRTLKDLKILNTKWQNLQEVIAQSDEETRTVNNFLKKVQRLQLLEKHTLEPLEISISEYLTSRGVYGHTPQ